MSASRNSGGVTSMTMHAHAVFGAPTGLVNYTVSHQYGSSVIFHMPRFDTDLVGGLNTMPTT